MSVPGLAVFAAIVFLIVIIGLFIELGYNKNHAKLVFVAPERIVVIKGKRFHEKDDIVIYNADTCTMNEALEKVAKSKRSNYRNQKITKHLCKKLSKPFDQGYQELRNMYAESMPVSFIYKTATSVVDLAHNLVSNSTEETSYCMLISNNSRRVAFFDDGNIYIN